MPIVVNKQEKRRAIALASRELLLEHGIKNITISKIAECAGVGKGTIYEYFTNKEDIVFEIISVFITEHEAKLNLLIDEPISTKQKLKGVLSSIYTVKNSQEELGIYREFLAIAITSNIPEMIAFSQECRARFIAIVTQIIDVAIEKKEIKPEAKTMISMLHTYFIGLVVDTKTHLLNPQEEIDAFVQTLFALIENKENR